MSLRPIRDRSIRSLLAVIIAVLAVGIACIPLALYGSAGDEAGLGRLEPPTTTQPPATTRPTTTTRNFSAALTGPCAVADRLLIGGYLTEARAEYERLLREHPTTTSGAQGDTYACVANGLAKLAQPLRAKLT